MGTANTTAGDAEAINEVLKECDRLLDPDVFFHMDELASVQRRAIHCLLAFGPQFDAIREKIEELQFNPIMQPLWRLVGSGQSIPAITRFRDKESFDAHIAGTLHDLRKLLSIANAKKKATARASQSKDPERLTRRKAIARAYSEHRGNRKYIAPICRDLQRAKITMPQRWLDEWKAKGLRIEPCDWFIACQDGRARAKIKKYISKVVQSVRAREQR